MCFGNKTTSTETKSYTPNAGVSSAANQNLNFAQGLQTQGFTPYSGPQVANFSPLQGQSFDMAKSLGDNGGAYTPEVESLLSRYGMAPASSVSADTIASKMNPYMNQYVSYALAPQLEMQNQQFATQNKGFDANATGAGAFGDTGWGLGRTNLTQQQDTARQGLIGSAYNAAFNTAIGAGAQDVSNSLGAQTTNAGLQEQALARSMGAAGGFQNLGNYRAGMTNLVNTIGGQQTAQDQAKINADYNQWLMKQQYPFQTTQLLNQTTAAGAQAMPAGSTSTTAKPDNSGWGVLGSVAGAALAPFTGGMSMAIAPALAGMISGAGGGVGGSSGSSGSGEGGGGGAPNPGPYMAYSRAKGGPLPAGATALVGEKGPEVFKPDDGSMASALGIGGPEVVVPKKSGTVIPHNQVRALAAKKNAAKKYGKPKPQGDSLAAVLGLAA